MKKSKLLLVLTVLTYIFLIGPMLVMIGTAFNAGSALAFPPTGFSLQWFEKAFSSPSFIEGFKTSFVVSLGGTLLAMLLGVPAAYAMNKYKFPMKGLVNGFFISPTLIPAVVLGFSLLKSFVPSVGGSIYSGLLVGYTLIGNSLHHPRDLLGSWRTLTSRWRRRPARWAAVRRRPSSSR